MLLLCFFSTVVYNVHAMKHHIIRVDSLLPSKNCSTTTGPQRPSTLQITHRHGPCSPFPTTTTPPTPAEILRHDRARLAFLQRKHSRPESSSSSDSESEMANIPATTPPMGIDRYVVTVGYGTPVLNFTVVFDTGSSRCWIQCQPCTSCYSQIDPIFDPSASSSYANIACGATQCTQSSDTVCSASNCMYYDKNGTNSADGSTTNGNLATETLTLTSDDVFPDFAFGCREDEGHIGGFAGLLGLGREYGSLVQQTSATFGGVFSYCLPSSSSSNGFLTFGSDDDSTTSTPLLSQPMQDLYNVGLSGISVNGQNLGIPPSVFSTAGTVVDSGTTITQLPQGAYDALRSAFQAGMSQYPTAPGNSMFDTCYDLSNYHTVTVPTVTLHFDGGADLEVDHSGTLFTESGVSCLAFAAATGVGIIGNTQQKTVEVAYDLGAERLSFRPGACT
ncbi:Protein ASPARTIC PROTEASE IN GUARD CELL 2 [Acorus calamus]|uniref:Protein ASPARTIC PROTEASE IN GUARD CELL 2 n=1 Tax=Acorus calamus TaxID=4465 RepID=A0AAV9E7H8_ACOCL|nr:Protein ASPARTIC PROTEASE IN GUARD CELL 2 [Acorus calamus]